MHQTVKDFIVETGGLSEIFKECPIDTTACVMLHLLSGSIMMPKKLTYIPQPIDLERMDKSMYPIVKHNWMLISHAVHYSRLLDQGEDSASELERLLDNLDKIASAIFGSSLQRGPFKPHWAESKLQLAQIRDKTTGDNFFSYAIQSGLENYVPRKFHGTIPTKSGKLYLEYALATETLGILKSDIFMWDFFDSWEVRLLHPASPAFVAHLLEHGANPNEPFKSSRRGDEGEEQTV